MSEKRLTPQLSIYAFTLSPVEPQSWDFVFDLVRPADQAGIGPTVPTGEHVVFGEHLEEYGRISQNSDEADK